jgi:hypothetical protein
MHPGQQYIPAFAGPVSGPAFNVYIDHAHKRERCSPFGVFHIFDVAAKITLHKRIFSITTRPYLIDHTV